MTCGQSSVIYSLALRCVTTSQDQPVFLGHSAPRVNSVGGEGVHAFSLAVVGVAAFDSQSVPRGPGRVNV